MFIRFLTGRRAGQIAEMKFADAQPLIDDGRAELVNYGNSAGAASGPATSNEAQKPGVPAKSETKKKRGAK